MDWLHIPHGDDHMDDQEAIDVAHVIYYRCVWKPSPEDGKIAYVHVCLDGGQEVNLVMAENLYNEFTDKVTGNA